MSSFFWGQTPTLTPDGAQRKRELAAQFAAQMRAPRNLGEGLTHLGNAWAARRMMDRADKAEDAGRASAQGSSSKAMDAIRAAMAGGKPKPYASSAGPMSILGMKPTPEQEIGDEAMAALGKPEAMSDPGFFNSLEQQHGLPAGYLARTAQIESSGNPNAQNPNSSAGGMFQFIDSTAQQYGLTDKTDPRASAQAAARLAADNAAHLRGVLGREPTAAELYLAHQQGAGGAAKLLSNPNANAANLLGNEALTLNGGTAHMTAGEFANQWLGKFDGSTPQPTSQPDYSAVYEALANPWLDQGQRSMLMGMLQQAQQQNDPLRQMQLERAELELAQMRNPQPGFSVLTDEQEAEMGLDPANTYQRGANGKISQIGGGGTNVSVSTEAAIPKGYRAIRDEQGRLLSYEPVPGGPEDTSAADAKAVEAKTTSANIVMDEIGIAKELIAGQSTLSPATGLTGSIASTIDSTRAGALKNRLTTIKANIGFDKLQSMRDASPTGGALGQVSEFENRLLQSVFGSLEQAQSEEDILYNLGRLEQLYTRIIHEGIPENEAREMYRQIEVGGLTPGASDSQSGATDYSTMGLNDLINLDLDTLTPAQQEALSRRFQELGY